MTRDYGKNNGMKKINITVITDGAFALFSAFIISLCVMRYFRISYPAAIISSALIGVAVSVPVFYILYTIREKKILRRADEQEKNKLMLHLALTKQQDVVNMLCSMRDIIHNIKYFYVECGDDVLYPAFTVEPLGADKIAEIAKKFSDKNLTVYCGALSHSAKKLCDELKIKTVTGDEVYLKMKEKNLLPEKYICDVKKRTLKEKFSSAAAGTNSRPFITGGLGLMIFSLFTIFPVYYLISGIILFVFGIIIRFIPKRKA